MKSRKLFIRDASAVEADDRSLSGYAIVFNQRSELLFDPWIGNEFYETIAPEACTQEFINSQDIRVLYNHLPERGSLARSKRGEGTLNLEVDEHGVHFQFNCPDTPFGNEILDAVRRGDVDRMSFAFYADEKATETTKNEDGTYERVVKKMHSIVEISLLDVAPAYSDTSVDNRNQNQDTMDEKNIKELQDQITALQSQVEQLQEASREDEEPKEDETPAAEEDETPAAEDETPDEEEREDEETPSEDEEPEETPEEEEKPIEENKRHNQTMKKQFSLLGAIRQIVNTGKLDNANQAISNLGAQELRAAGLPCTGQIQIPMSERANEVTVTAEHDDVIVTEFTDILEPLRANNALANAGARIMTGLVGDLQIPVMNGNNVGWAGEIAAASAGGATFDHALLQPKRLTAYVDVSKQFIVQDSLGAEAMIRADLVKAIQDKLEATILGSAAGSTTQPAGIFNGVSPTSVADFGDITDLEATVEAANFNGPFHYICSPAAKANMRSMIIGTTGPAGMVWQNNEIDGVPAEVTTHMAAKTFAYGDWKNLVVGQWGAIDLTIDPYSQAVNGVVRITVNAFFDAKLVRSGAVALGTFA